MSEKRLKRLAALVGLALLAVIATGALLGSRSAADDLQAQAERALASANLDGVHVAFHGREAELSGGDTEELSRAELVVEGIEGVRWADIVSPTSTPTPEPPDTTPTLELSHKGGAITISGTVPDADAAASIKAYVAEAFAVPVTGDLAIDPVVGTAPWIRQLTDVFGDIVGVKGLALTIDGTGTLDLAGSIESRTGADDVRRMVATTVPDLHVVSRLDVRPGDLSEADATVLNAATLHFEGSSAVLDPADERVLDAVADVLQRTPSVAIRADGYVGPVHRTAGERISLARVTAVKAYLVEAGVSASRISTRTLASYSRTSKTPAEQFRRVDFVVRGS